MSLRIDGKLVSPDGVPVSSGQMTLTWGSAAIVTPLEAGGRFVFLIGAAAESAESTGESAPMERGDGMATRGNQTPATVGLSYEGKALLMPQGLGTMLIDGGERWELGTLVFYADGMALLSPAGTWYGFPATPAAAIEGPVLEAPKGLSDVLGSTGTQIDGAKKSLGGSSVSLGSVDVLLKGAATDEGFAFVASEGHSKVNVGSLSQVSAGYTSDEPTPVRVGGSATVPALGGYTRALSERKLTRLGLVPEFNAQTTSTAGLVGRVVDQRPAPGGVIEQGSTVRLFLGKAAPSGVQ